MNVSIIIPNWNGEEKLKRNLPKVLKVKDLLEVIVVDDASTDGSVDVLKKEFPSVKLVEQNENHGFSTSCNVGVKMARGELVFLLNTDALPDMDCLKFVLPHFKDPKVFSVGLSSGGNWSWARFKDGFFWHFMSEEKLTQSHETLWGSGGSSVYRKDVWEILGGFDELFNRFYEEDVDLGYRALKRGYKNIFEPKAKVLHYKEKGVIEENFSQDFIKKTAQRNQLFFIWKNIHDKNLIREHILVLIKMLLFNPKYWTIFLSAIAHFPQVLKERKIEKIEAKVGDKDILERF